MTNTSANHYHRSRLIGKILQPCALFSQMRRLTEGTHLSGFCFSSHKAPAALDISEVGGVERIYYTAFALRTISIIFRKAGTLLSSLQMADNSTVSRRSSTSFNTTLSGFLLSADLMVKLSPIPPATKLSIVVSLFPSCTMFSVRPEA